MKDINIKLKNKFKNIFFSTRFKLDLFAAIFVFFFLSLFSFSVYKLLTVDIIYQISPVFKSPEIQKYINSELLFDNFRSQTLFLLIFIDIIIFIFSVFIFDRFLKKILAPIEYLSKIQTRFAENLSHELRTPLSIINMRSEILKDEIKKKEKEENNLKNYNYSLNEIIEEVNNINQLIDNLLFEARVKYRENKIENVLVSSIQENIENVFNKLKYLKKEKVDFYILNQIDKIYMNNYINLNKFVFVRILNNLLSNSLKFTEKGQVKIILENYKKYNFFNLKFLILKKNVFLRIKVKDTGIGIEKKDLKKVFERFYRGDNVEGKISGTGVGLPMIKDLIEKNDLKIKVQSQINQGTEIILENIKIL